MLNTTLPVSGVGFSMAGLVCVKFRFCPFQCFLFTFVIVISILLKSAF